MQNDNELLTERYQKIINENINWIKRKTGVDPKTRCIKCGITAEESFKKGPASTGINHPEYSQTYSFYKYGENQHMCPRCHKEHQLDLSMKSMDAYAAKHGEKKLAQKFGIK